MTLARAALVLQLGTTLPLAGLIWLVQVVSYPLFSYVGAPEFLAYHAAHCRRITYVVGPLMLGELVGALAFLVAPPVGVSRAVGWVGAALVFMVWAVTAFASVPAHNVLGGGFDRAAHALLVATNGLRTAAWSLRTGLLLWLVAKSA